MSCPHEWRAEGDRFTLTEAAHLLGINKGALYHWIKRNRKLYRCPKIGKYRYVTVTVLEQYERSTCAGPSARHGRRPEGWLSFQQALEVAECTRSELQTAVKDGQLRVVRDTGINYYCPEDLAYLRLITQRPPPGCMEVNHYADQHGADRCGVVRWLRRSGYPISKCTANGKRTWFAPKDALDAWEKQYLARNPRAPICHAGKLPTPQDTRMLKAA